MPSRHSLQQAAIAISVVSVIYNIAEGIVSVVFGLESSSRSLVFFGIQSAIEVASSAFVVWRFCHVRRPGDETGNDLEERADTRFERISTIGIGMLLIMLAVAAIVSSIVALTQHEHPSPSNATLIVSASTMFITFVLWIPKRYLSRALNSSTMQGEALCALSCIQFSAVLCIGSLIYRLWRGGWWVDSATAILIALLFGWEGQKMVKWARDAAFDGGCCGHCKTVPGSRSTVTGDSKDSEVAISDSHEVISATSPVSERCTGNDSCGISDTSHVHASEVAK